MTARRVLAMLAISTVLAVAAGFPRGAAGQERRDSTQSEKPKKSRRRAALEERDAQTAEREALLERAAQFARIGRCDLAIPLLEELVGLQPRIEIAAEILAGCYRAAGRAQDAAALLERMLESDPECFAYIRDLGLAYLDLGRRTDAVAVWRRALKEGDDNSATYGAVARLQREAGFYDEAIETYRAGSVYKPHGEYYSNEIVRLERILGRSGNALREALHIMGRREEAAETELRTAAAIYRDANDRGALMAMVDSALAAGGGRPGAVRAAKIAFLLEDGRGEKARAELFGAPASEMTGKRLHALLRYAFRARDEGEPSAYDDFSAAAARRYLERFPGSPIAADVTLMLAESTRLGAARATGAARAAALQEALALAEAARTRGGASAYRDRAAILRARILFEDLHQSGAALRELDGIGSRAAPRLLEAEELRMRALVASFDRDAAARRLSALAADGDSSVARVGEYGLAALAFRRGAYGEAAQSFAELAEKHPSSAWANDALAGALEIRAALPEGTGALDLYRAAVVSAERGEWASAADSLAALERRHPSSALVPRTVFMRAEIAEAEGRALEAAADFARVSERFPAHDLAPRALERAAALAERESADEALEAYRSLMERYPEYPFMERVRGRYAALEASAGAGPERSAK